MQLKKLKNYLLNLLIAIDECGNAILGGSPHETISSRVGRNYPGTIFAKVVNTIMVNPYHLPRVNRAGRLRRRSDV